MCSFYWSHRLGPLQPVIRLQVLYPLILALPHPPPVSSQARAGGRPHSPPTPADVSTGVPLRGSAVCFSPCGLAALVIVPIHRLCAPSIPVISKHSRVTMNLIPRWEPTALWRDGWFQTGWEASAQTPSSHPHPSEHRSLHLLHGQIALRELSARPLWLLAAMGLHRNLPNFFWLLSWCQFFAFFKKWWSHKVQIVFKLSEWQCQTPLTSFLWNLPTNSGDGFRET